MKLIENGVDPEFASMKYLTEMLDSELSHLKPKDKEAVIEILKQMLSVPMMNPKQKENFARTVLVDFNFDDRKFFYEAIMAPPELRAELELYVKSGAIRTGIVKGTTLYAYHLAKEAVRLFVKYKYYTAMGAGFVLLWKIAIGQALQSQIDTELEDDAYSVDSMLEEKNIEDEGGINLLGFKNHASPRLMNILKELPESFSFDKSSKVFQKLKSVTLVSGEVLTFYEAKTKAGAQKVVISSHKIKRVDEGFSILIASDKYHVSKKYSFKPDGELESKLYLQQYYPDHNVYINGSEKDLVAITPKPNFLDNDKTFYSFDEIYKDEMKADHVSMAIIDTGVDYSRSQLMKNLIVNNKEVPDDGIDNDKNGIVDDAYGFNFSKNNSNTHSYPWVYHGSQVTEIAIRDSQKIKFMPLVWTNVGRESSTHLKEILSYLLKWNTDHPQDKIRIVNMSFSGNSITQEEKQLIAANKDVLFVVAGGNGQEGKDGNHAYPSELDLPNLLSVAALNDDGDDKAEFSASGPNVDVLAPGENIRVINGSLKSEQVSGTSFAAPYVANIAAKVLLINPDLNVEELKNLILESVTKKAEYKDLVYTSGAVSAELAYKAAIKSKKTTQ